jgi:hypothetical protein
VTRRFSRAESPAESIANANRRDAELAGEHAPQPDSRTEPWFVPRRSDWEGEVA